MNSDYLKALLFIILLDLMLFLTQYGIDSVSADIGANMSIYDSNGSYIKSVDSGDFVLSTNMSKEFPSVSQSVSTDTGGILSYFTERWSAIRNAILDTPYLGTAYKLINALPRFLTFMGAPDYLIFALGAAWHLFMIGILLLLLFG